MKFPKRKKTSEARYYLSLTRWMALVIIFVSITPMILVSGFYPERIPKFLSGEDL